MASVVSISGIEDDVPTPPAYLLMWGIAIGTTIGIFVGTLLLNPGKKRKS